MFVVVTALCVWLGWQLKVVRERRAIIAELERRYPESFAFTTLESLERFESEGMKWSFNPRTNQFTRVALTRRLFGDESYVFIRLPRNTDPSLTEKVEYAFPEARLMREGPMIETHTEKRDFGFRDSLFAPEQQRKPNQGNIFKTGLIEK